MKLKIIFATIVVSSFGILNVGANCNGPSASTITTDLAGEVLCVIGHDQEPPSQILVSCAGLALTDIQNILAADASSSKYAGDGGVPTAEAFKSKK